MPDLYFAFMRSFSSSPRIHTLPTAYSGKSLRAREELEGNQMNTAIAILLLFAWIIAYRILEKFPWTRKSSETR